MTGAGVPITCEHDGDAGLTREGLSRCPMCRRDQCGDYNPTVPQVPGSRRKRVERCSKRRGHSTPHSWQSQPAAYTGNDAAVTQRVARPTSAPVATVAPQDLAAGEVPPWKG